MCEEKEAATAMAVIVLALTGIWCILMALGWV